MKTQTLEKCVVPDTWKVWTECDGELHCLAIFQRNLDAHAYAGTLDQPTLVTRSSTISMTKE